MNLQNFVTSAIETMGGIVEPIEYAICHVLIPEEYKNFFQDKTEFLLAFDFEVSEENPGAEFVTFGSYFLDQILSIIREKTVTTIRYVIVDKLSLYNPQEKIKKFLDIDRGILKIKEERIVQYGFAVFNFIVGYTLEERIEECHEIWIDMDTNEISKKMQLNKGNIFYEPESENIYPVIELTSTMKVFETAFDALRNEIEIKKNGYKDELILVNEIKRIEEYYEELLIENNKKTQRKGVTEEKIKELQSKKETLLLEKQKQLKEITEKYTVTTDISLENSIVYLMPAIKYTVKLEIGHKEEEKLLYYNCITKEFMSKIS